MFCLVADIERSHSQLPTVGQRPFQRSPPRSTQKPPPSQTGARTPVSEAAAKPGRRHRFLSPQRSPTQTVHGGQRGAGGRGGRAQTAGHPGLRVRGCAGQSAHTSHKAVGGRHVPCEPRRIYFPPRFPITGQCTPGAVGVGGTTAAPLQLTRALGSWKQQQQRWCGGPQRPSLLLQAFSWLSHPEQRKHSHSCSDPRGAHLLHSGRHRPPPKQQRPDNSLGISFRSLGRLALPAHGMRRQ